MRFTSILIFYRNSAGEAGESKADGQEDPENDKDGKDSTPQEAPTKCISNTLKVQIKAQIQYIDFEGRADGTYINKHYILHLWFLIQKSNQSQ